VNLLRRRQRGQLDRALGDDGTGVHALVDEVDRDPEHLDAVGQRVLDRPKPRERRQQGRVHVDHAFRKPGQEVLGEQLHVAGQHHELHAPGNEPLGDGEITGAASLRLVGGNGHDLDPLAPVHLVDQGLEVGPRPRGQHGDVHATRSLGNFPPVERRVPAASSSSTRPSTSLECR
jgi:hypothetical protein